MVKIVTAFLIIINFLTATNGLMCHSCINAASEEECDRQRAVKCSVDQGMCYTEIRNFGSRVSITKSCYQELACNTLASQNTHQCPKACSICCKGEKCNYKGPPKCMCKYPTTTTPRSKRPKRTTPTLPPRIRDKPKPPGCEDVWFLPIATDSAKITCDFNSVNDRMACERERTNLVKEGIEEQFFFNLRNRRNQVTQTLECKIDKQAIDLEGFDEAPMYYTCINTTGDTNVEEDDDSYEYILEDNFNLKSIRGRIDVGMDHLLCDIDQMSILQEFTEEQAYEYMYSGDFTDEESAILYNARMAQTAAHFRIFKACPGRALMIVCQRYTPATPLPEEGSGQEITKVVKGASIGDWWVALAVAGGIILVIILLGALYRQCAKNGFYLINRKRKITPEPDYEASEMDSQTIDYRLYKR